MAAVRDLSRTLCSERSRYIVSARSEPRSDESSRRIQMREEHMRRGGPPRGRGWRFEGDGPPGVRRGRMRRGDIRTAVLAVLAEEPGHGYEVMQRLEAKSEGAWRPSPGSVYPMLQQLEDEGLVQSTERDGKRVFE